MRPRAALPFVLLFFYASVTVVILAGLNAGKNGAGLSLWPIDACFNATEVGQELCTHLDDWKAWLRRWDYFPLVHMTNAFTAFYLLAISLRGTRRIYAALFSALVVFFIGWVMELVEEVSFAIVYDPGAPAPPNGFKREYDPPDAIIGDPTAHLVGAALGVAFSHATGMLHPLAEVPTWRWLVHVLEAAGFLYLSAFGSTLFYADTDEVRAQFYLWRRVARPDWLGWTLVRLGGLLVLWGAHRLAGDARRDVWGRGRRAFDRVWAWFLAANVAIHLLTMWLWMRQFYLVLWLAPTMLALILLAGLAWPRLRVHNEASQRAG